MSRREPTKSRSRKSENSPKTMRETLRPVTLKRIIEVSHICQQGHIDLETLKEKLDLSQKRAKEIVLEMERTALVDDVGGELQITSSGERVCEGYDSENWQQIHQVLYENSPHYQEFMNLLINHSGDYGLTEDELLDQLDGRHEDIRFNKTGLDVVGDWGERLGAIQRNVFEDRYYSVISTRKDETFVDVLQEEYADMDVERGIGMRTTHVSIPEIRELVCERLRLTRDEFDQRLVDRYMENIGKMELSGAPLDTQAKESRFGIKTISKSEEGGHATSEMVSDRVLDGIALQDGKMYYYLAIFEQLVEE